MNNNEIQRYTSILLGKENVETLSDLQLLFNRYDVNISRRFYAVNVVKNIFIANRLMRKILMVH